MLIIRNLIEDILIKNKYIATAYVIEVLNQPTKIHHFCSIVTLQWFVIFK